MKRRHFLALTSVVAAAGCTRIPTSGPVIPVAPASSHSSEQGVGIAPQPPVPGGSPDVILAGFLAAMTSDRQGYPVARQYLTQSASDDWKPESGALIYESDNHPPITTNDSAALNAPVVGALDVEGRFTPRTDNIKHNFRMVKVDGEWRIGDPPAGLLLARYLFERYYRPVALYFLASDQMTLAVDLVHLPEQMVSPTSVLTALLAGPAAWLRPVVGTAIPSDTRLSVASVTVDGGGTAEVSLTDQVAALSERQRQQLAAQVMWTMNQFPNVTSVLLSMNGQPWPLSWDATGRVQLRDVDAYAALDSRTWANVHVAKGDVLGSFDDRSGGAFTPLAGAWGRDGWGDTVGALAISRDELLGAVVDAKRQRLWVGQTQVGTPSRAFEGDGLVRPQITADSVTWTISSDGTGASRLVRVPRNGDARATEIEGLPAGRVTAFRISPDLTRIAMVLAQGDGATLGMARLRERDGGMHAEAWHALPLQASQGLLTGVRDIAWAEASELLVVGASDADPHHAVYRVRIDGSRVEALGPSGPEIEITALSALPRVSGTTAIVSAAKDVVWRFEDRFRWQNIESGFPVAVLPG